MGGGNHVHLGDVGLSQCTKEECEKTKFSFSSEENQQIMEQLKLKTRNKTYYWKRLKDVASGE